MISWPFLSIILSIPSAKKPDRISGPFVSNRTAEEQEDVVESQVFMQAITASNVLKVLERRTHIQLTNVPAFALRHFSQTLQHFVMPLLTTVRKVETGHVHSSIHERPEAFVRPAGGPHGANNLGATFGHVGGPADRVQRNVATV